MSEKIIIFDTTLRDGEQAPGASLNVFEKLEIAKQLERLNVDVIEAGFPVSSQGQFESVQRIADSVNTIIAGLARTIIGDIDACHNSLKGAERSRIHTFIGTSDIHINGKFESSRYGKSLPEKQATILKMATDAVQYAKTFTDDVEFSAEDAGRTDIGYLCEIIEAVIDAGANTVNIPDTTGYTMPQEFGAKIIELKSRVSNIDQAVMSVHCHNDLGLAVANSLFAVASGARQVECTINGIGERAGNASMEEFVMSLNVRPNFWNFHTDINTEEIYNSSRMVSGFTGMLVQPNKAIVGENAFAHESGIHQDGMLKNRDTYEIMTPESVGIVNNKIVLGRHSGRHGLLSRLKALGYEVSDEKMGNIYKRFILLADNKKEIFDEDLIVLMGDESKSEIGFYYLDYLHVNLGTTIIATATVRIKTEEKIGEESATGDGPVDACFRAINRAINFKEIPKLEHYQVRSITAGKGAQGEVSVRIKIQDSAYSGKGVSTDTIRASAKAYLQALNHYESLNNMENVFEEITETS
ncbi:MAG: 2-isopropylmalate synthase [Candidatus Marinimicrobia bacterium]|nr:2-isopropylmalate synthase [Candidatus Neomarinimicrobiota bacterium]